MFVVAEKNYEEGHCPGCGARRADIVAQHKNEYHGYEYDEVTYYSILECRGCGETYFKSSSTNSEDYYHDEDPHTGEFDIVSRETNYYWPPVIQRHPPAWASDLRAKDQVLGSLFDDVYTALSNDLAVLAAIGMRTVFDRASELLEIAPNKTFQQKLEGLRISDHITQKEVSVLAVLIDAGSAAAHRGWKPKPRQLDAMTTILEAFLHRAFFLEEIGVKLGRSVPPRT